MQTEPTSELLAASVVVTRYDEPDETLHNCIDSLIIQNNVDLEIIVLDQQDSVTTRDYCNSLTIPNIALVYTCIPRISLSFARNRGIELSTNDAILYIDADAKATEDWAHDMAKALSENGVGVVGSRLCAEWTSKPHWLAKSSIIQEQYSLLDLGDSPKLTDRVIGASFGIATSKLDKEAFFDENLGRKRGNLAGGEEIDLCRRAQLLGLRIKYLPNIVYHAIQPERGRFRWIAKRIVAAGESRAARRELPRTIGRSRNYYDYLFAPIFIPIFAFGFIRKRITS